MWNSLPIPQQHSAPSARRGRGAFTLIELLVVISIISLLVSILLPSIGRAKGLAKSVVCRANLKGMAIALAIYAEEWNELYPVASNVGKWGYETSNGVYSWMEQLYPYVETKKLYVCPEKPNGSEYSYFLGVRAVWYDLWIFDSVQRNRIRYSSAFVLAGCTGREFLYNPAQNEDDCDKDDYTQDCLGFPVHSNGTQNILFDDSHSQEYTGYVEGDMTFQYREMASWVDSDPELNPKFNP
ncbi:MAG: type II secretion system protein [Phycisphaerae bacterium]|nr:type II secretion system protein [Phycisphaerae bacterium]